MDRALAAREYAGHLTDTDLTLLAPARPGTGPGDGSWLRGDPAALLRLLEDPGTFGTVLGEGPQGWAVQASPFLIFALLVQRAMTELASAAHVPERTGPRQRVPLFDTPALREFLADTARRLFLAELLASFTRVASGRYRVRVAGRARTRRFSELDPVRLAGLLDAVPDRGVSRLRDVSRVRPCGRGAVAARGRPARSGARAAGRRAGHRPARAPRRPLVPDRLRGGPGADGAAGRARRRGRPVPPGPARAQPPGRPVPAGGGSVLVRCTRFLGACRTRLL